MNATDRRTQSTVYRLRRAIVDEVAARSGASTADDIAALLQVDRSTYFRLLAGGTPKLDTALRMAEAAGCDVAALFEVVR